MALTHSWILPICLIWSVNMATGQMAAFYDFPEQDESTYSFAEISNVMARNASATRLTELRWVMAELGLHAYIIPTADAHNSLRIHPADARREWLTGFLGAAGTAVVTQSQALVWTDGRYWTQFDLEADRNLWQLMREGIDVPLQDWLVQNMPQGYVVGVDPTTYTRTAWISLQSALGEQVYLRGEENNLVDLVRRRLNDYPPERPQNPLLTLSQAFTGRPASNKIAELVNRMNSVGASALVLTTLDEVAWTLNLRGSDIPFNPVFFSYLVIRTDRPITTYALYWHDGNLTRINNMATHRVVEGLEGLEGRPYDAIFYSLTQLSNELGNNRTIWVSATSSQAVHQAIGRGPARIVTSPISPVALMKIYKNDVELEGFRQAHIRDGIALIRALSWVERQVTSGHVLTEIQVVDELERLRRLELYSMGPSFSSIVGAGSNGAIIHYRPNRNGPHRIITTNDMVLIDSGGQYLDGSTDITRTRHMGNCTEAQRIAFTRVMKGNINLATTLMPQGTMGHSVDVLARKFLWDIGFDYAHGSGHGLGHFLHIHEFPARIHSTVTPNDPGISPRMIYSNEPGYYEVGQFGIRHEDIVETIAVTSTTNHTMAAGLVGNFQGRGVVGFSTITQVPHQTSCLDVKLMTKFEIEYLNEFHARIFRTIGPLLQRRNLTLEYAWLEKECAPISGAIFVKSIPFLAAISVVVIWLGM